MNKTIKKAKPYLVTSVVALGGIFVLSTLANRSQIVATVKNKVFQGV